MNSNLGQYWALICLFVGWFVWYMTLFWEESMLGGWLAVILLPAQGSLKWQNHDKSWKINLKLKLSLTFRLKTMYTLRKKVINIVFWLKTSPQTLQKGSRSLKNLFRVISPMLCLDATWGSTELLRICIALSQWRFLDEIINKLNVLSVQCKHCFSLHLYIF